MANLTNLNNKFLVTTGGNVGINSTSPGEKLEVNGNIQSLDTIMLKNSSSGVKWQLYRDGNETLNFRYNNSSSWSANAISIKNNNNVGIGTYNPLSKLTVSEGTDQHGIELAPGTLSYLQCYDRATSTYGNMTIDAKYLAFGLDNGAEKIRFTADGNVGIGTNSPTRQLHLLRTTGDVRGIMVETTVATSYAEVQVKASREWRIGTGGSSTTPAGDFYIYDATEGAHRFDIDDSGNAVLGGGNPTSLSSNTTSLAVNSTRNDLSGGIFHHANGTYKAYNYWDSGGYITQIPSGAGDVRWHINNAERMRIVSSGNVGIGTTSPSYKLHVSGTGGTRMSVTNTDTNWAAIQIQAKGNQADYIFFKDDTEERARIAALDSNDLVFYNTDSTTERMRIASNGHVGIGTTSPASLLHVSGNSFLLGANYGIYGNNDITNYYIKGNSSGSQLVLNWFSGFQFKTSGGTDRVLIDSTGDVGIGTTSPGAKLDVNGATYVRNVLYTYAGAGNQYGGLSWNNPDNGFLFLKASNVTKVNINSSGNSYFNGGHVGIGKTNPSTDLDVQGVITCGDSTTDGAIRRQHQTFATMKPGPSSGGSVDMMFVDHTHSLDITVVAYINTSNVATGRGYSVIAYGGGSAGLTQTSFAGNVSALSISYVNTGGSENYILRVTCTYSGATAPVISVTANGQSISELRAAT
tara:strand:+ start:1050 stop:3122 length:2073 start_codon:yes stop_codon:yes gene_type:complete